jgi:uncharacterized membrane protein
MPFRSGTAVYSTWLSEITEVSILAIDTIALVIILAATFQAVVGLGRLLLMSPTMEERRAVWLHYARWLIVGLTFQLAADIIETSITTDWESIARLAAIAIIRTMLNYFLERDYESLRAEQEARP